MRKIVWNTDLKEKENNMNNIVQVILDCTYPEANKKVWQYDYGQILRIQGQQLPKAVEIHFSLTQSSGDSITRIGTTQDGVTDVPIPDSLLENSGKSQNYDIYAYIYIEDGTSGNTEYRIRIPVRTRPKPEIHETQEETELFRETIKAVNDAAGRTETSEQNAKTSEAEAGRYAEEARENAQETAQTKEVALEEIREKKQGAISAIKKQEESSIGNVTEHADTEIQRIQNQTSESKSELESTIEQAANKNTKLEESIQTARGQKSELDKSIESAGGQKSELINSVNAAERTKTGLDESIQNATDKKAALDTTIGQANTVDASLKEQIGGAEKIQENVEQIDKNKTDISSLKEDMATKLDSPIDLPEVGKVLKVKSVNEDGTFVCEWANTPTGGSGVEDAQINGKSIVKDGVADIPIGSAGKPGVIGIPGGNYGLEKDTTNNIRLIGLNNNDIDKRHYAKPLLGNTLDYAIKSAMSAPIANTAGMIEGVYHYPAWTSDEQAAARERMGIDEWEIIADVALEEDVNSYKIQTQYGYKQIKVFLDNVKDSTNGSFYCYGIVKRVNGNYQGVISIAYGDLSTRYRYGYIGMECINENVIAVTENSVNSSKNTIYGIYNFPSFKQSWYYSDKLYGIEFTPVKEADILKAGTKIQVYGVRA